jgi:hypothetical protein
VLSQESEMEGAKQHVDLARQFAAALDKCDYPTAAAFLAKNCQYERPGQETLIGPEAICQSYDESDVNARSKFDSVIYHSQAEAAGPDGVRLTFFDELRVDDASYTFRCGQIVYFGEDQKINRIELAEIPSERERLNDFCAAMRIQLH